MAELVLYYSPGACSLAAHIALYEWGKPFAARPVLIAKGEHNEPEFIHINARGRLPVLTIDGKPARELSGLLTWIGQQSGHYPKTGSYDAAKCGEWLGWSTSTVHIAFALIWRGGRFAYEERVHPELRQRGYDWVADHFAEIEATLDKTPYVLGDAYSVADMNLAPFFRWGNRIGLDMRALYPAWTAHAERLLAREGVQKALAAEGITIWDTAPLPDGVSLAKFPA